MREDILRKLQKLQSMIKGGTENEALNAARIYDRLIEKYDVSIDELETRERRKFPCTAETFRYMAHICNFLGLSVYSTRGKAKPPLWVDATQAEMMLVADISSVVIGMLKEQKRAARLRVNSYMLGFIAATYPVSDENPKCPTCETVTKYSGNDRRYYCERCGWIGKKLKQRKIDAESYFSGKTESGTLLERKTA
jgi:hypothetical protein